MKVKLKENELYNIKNITTDELQVLYRIMAHVRLGDGMASDVAFKFIKAFEINEPLMELFEDYPDIEITATTEEGEDSIIDPTLELRYV